MNPFLVGLAVTVLAGPVSAATQKKAQPKPAQVAQAPARQEPAAPASGVPVSGFQTLRAAPCTMILRGRTTMNLVVQPVGEKKTRAKTITQDFEFTLPGRITETVSPGGDVEFAFTPQATLAGSEARGRLHLEDDFPAPGWAPIVMDATRLENVGPFSFRSLGRGQAIVPTGGTVVNLKGHMASQAPMTVKSALGETESRPVAATPLAALGGNLRQLDIPILRFTGASLWAWANSPNGMTAKGTVDYRHNKTASGTIDGQVEVTFHIAVTEAAQK